MGELVMLMNDVVVVKIEKLEPLPDMLKGGGVVQIGQGAGVGQGGGVGQIGSGALHWTVSDAHWKPHRHNAPIAVVGCCFGSGHVGVSISSVPFSNHWHTPLNTKMYIAICPTMYKKYWRGVNLYTLAHKPKVVTMTGPAKDASFQRVTEDHSFSSATLYAATFKVPKNVGAKKVYVP
jgi:hypothetical protein